MGRTYFRVMRVQEWHRPKHVCRTQTHPSVGHLVNVVVVVQLAVSAYVISKLCRVEANVLHYTFNKVITTMVIRPLDDPHDVLNLWSPICDPLVWGTRGREWLRVNSSLFIGCTSSGQTMLDNLSNSTTLRGPIPHSHTTKCEMKTTAILCYMGLDCVRRHQPTP